MITSSAALKNKKLTAILIDSGREASWAGQGWESAYLSVTKWEFNSNHARQTETTTEGGLFPTETRCIFPAN